MFEEIRTLNLQTDGEELRISLFDAFLGSGHTYVPLRPIDGEKTTQKRQITALANH